MGQAHDLAAAAAFQGDLEFAHQVFGLFLDLKVAVTQHAEFEMRLELVARKQPRHLEHQQIFERQEPKRAFGGGQGDETVDLRRDRQQRLKGALVAGAFQLKRQGVAGVGDEGEGVRGVNRQRGQNRKDTVQEYIVKIGQIGRVQISGAFEHDVLVVHL